MTSFDLTYENTFWNHIPFHICISVYMFIFLLMQDLSHTCITSCLGVLSSYFHLHLPQHNMLIWLTLPYLMALIPSWHNSHNEQATKTNHLPLETCWQHLAAKPCQEGLRCSQRFHPCSQQETSYWMLKSGLIRPTSLLSIWFFLRLRNFALLEWLMELGKLNPRLKKTVWWIDC